MRRPSRGGDDVRASNGPLASALRRGLCQVDVEVRCLERPVHSGQKGGAVPDPVQILCRIIADLSAKDGSLAIPGLYRRVARPFERLWGRPSLAVVAFEAQPILGSSNQILDSARARISMRTVPYMDAREAGELLVRRLTRNPPYGAHVAARVVRTTPELSRLEPSR
jgi:acetylornithine deacetylase/succinyl-diaminopimelate desuccinylase-like protein